MTELRLRRESDLPKFKKSGGQRLAALSSKPIHRLAAPPLPKPQPGPVGALSQRGRDYELIKCCVPVFPEKIFQSTLPLLYVVT